jgi:ppGpp synthetase/RelA/SpoT-type nucleotidyltranferase
MDIDQYEKEGQLRYAGVAHVVATILRAAIERAGGYRLQHIADRAKNPESLRKKLVAREIADTVTLEEAIKDLAGCRAVFYTNNDASKFVNSGIVDENFEILERKIHHPRQVVEDASELYVSNHFLVMLRLERATLPEYSSYADMRCEIQVQTILNHAWAEMAHDTIYKPPILESFGARQFDAIKERLQKVARKYLLPAGYEFQSIVTDFERLMQGKALFDGNALDAIVDAADNNVRLTALTTFTESVLPLYDDLPTVYPSIVSSLLSAADRARTAESIPIETPYGAIPGKTFGMVLKSIVDILVTYRYVDIDVTFYAALTLYGLPQTPRDKEVVLELCKALSKHNLGMWRANGPLAQAVVVQNIESLDDDVRRADGPCLNAMLTEVLGTEVSGTSSNSTSFTIHRGCIPGSNDVRGIRARAIAILKHQFDLCDFAPDKRAVLLAMQTAIRLPDSGYADPALAGIVLENTRDVIEFMTGVVPTLDLHLQQTTETFVHHCYWRFAELPEYARDNLELQAARDGIERAAVAFRDVVNQSEDFRVFKVLVGYDSVLPPAWEAQSFDYTEAEKYRLKQVDAFIGTVNEATADLWLDRVCRYAAVKSDDLATFPTFVGFLKKMGSDRPAIALRFLGRPNEELSKFFPAILEGLMVSTSATAARDWIDISLAEGNFIGQIAWYLRFADPFDGLLLEATLQSSIRHESATAVGTCLLAAVSQFKKHAGNLIDSVFLPALAYLKERNDLHWLRMPWFSWLDTPLTKALDQRGAELVLEALVPHPSLEFGAEHIAAAIGLQWPGNVMEFFGARQRFARTGEAPTGYDAIPYDVHQLKDSLAAVPELVLGSASKWFKDWPGEFRYSGARLVASVFPDLSSGVDTLLLARVDSGKEERIAFVLAVLAAFEGRAAVYPVLKSVVASLPPESPLLHTARQVLFESGVVTGFYGHADLMSERKSLMQTWLKDRNDRVVSFARDMVSTLDQAETAETRGADATMAARRLAYGEDIEGSRPEK